MTSESRDLHLKESERQRDLGPLAHRQKTRNDHDQSIATSEPAYIAKYAFQLAQEFNNFYHRHHILTEDEGRTKTVRCWPPLPLRAVDSFARWR